MAVEGKRGSVQGGPDADAWGNLGVAYGLSGNRTADLDAVLELRRLDPGQADELFNLIVPP